LAIDHLAVIRGLAVVPLPRNVCRLEHAKAAQPLGMTRGEREGDGATARERDEIEPTETCG